MAVMKKKGSKGLPPISTASLPDVIFMILFFFMVSTTMRDQELLVRYKLPEATEVQKLEKKSLVSFIHIGPPAMTMQAKFGTAPRIQLNDSYKSTRDILDFVAAERDKLSEADRASMTICLKADQTTKMGIVTDVKQELRRANALKVNMSHITGQAFSTSGAFLYHPSDRVTLKVFGSYDIGNSYGMSTHNYGATMSVDMSDRFGMEMGVQRYYDAMSGRWETVPVMIPYYHFDKFTLGLDVGGIIYEILRNAVFDKNRGIGGPSGPTIGPPRMHIPIR